jgi:hypothetical protein
MNGCKTCKWAVFEMTKHKPPRVNEKYVGRCEWPVPEMVALPLSITGITGRFVDELYKGAILAGLEGCPVWEGK